jgi:cellulose synthase/poly-beta-1,6-N-acetylglucosamine synthase-like glycosyltransferase
MCVSPIVAVYNPKGILRRVQQVEYFMGVFLREAFASLNAVHVTPGAFSAYRASFFKKHKGFDENNLTEDFEMALRIQSHDYIIENSLKSVVYAKSPKKFKELLIQRKRWYIGLIRNLIEYKRLFSKNHGALGLIVLPIAVSTIIISVFLTLYLAIKAMLDLRKELMLLDSINFDFLNSIEFSRYAFERFWFSIISDPMMLFFILFGLIIAGYMIFAKSKVKEHAGVKLSVPLFLVFYAFLFAFWWTLAFIYHFFDKNVKWR